MQLLSVLKKDEDRTFILSEVSEICIYNHVLPSHLWCSAKLLPQTNSSNDELLGALQVFGDDGTLYLEISGVKFRYLDKVGTELKSPKDSAGKICIASTFTADPVEDSLKFWNSHFNLDFDIALAPYNQVFQELLDPESLLSSNVKGFNIILLGLEDWTRKEHKLVPVVSADEMNRLFENKSRYTLPNRLEIVQLNKYETEYVYNEIFVDKCYLKHDIKINDGDTIIDIGANIGLFTLFVNQHCKDPVVYSFEPSPVVYELLKTNSKVYGPNVKTFNYGVSDKEKTATFTFYEKSSVFSSFNPDENEDKDAIQAVVRNLLKDSSAYGDDLAEYVDEVTSGRLESSSYVCRLLSVSDIIRENNIDKIDLLKIDAEKSELDIIRGIKDKDWDKIKQIVIEIHDKSGKVLEEIESVLNARGFKCSVEEEQMLKESGLYNVFATKNSPEILNNSNSNYQLKEERLSHNIENFVISLGSFIQRSKVPLIVAVSPLSPEISKDPLLKNLYEKHELELLRRISELPHIFTISSSSLANTYPVENYFDSLGDELGHIPYSLPFFTSIGTSFYRMILSVQSTPKKVIALDCDNTLWKGVCGEDGVKGIQIPESYQMLQQFLIDQIKSGMLVCLCSKNNEEDVMEIFNQRDDMLLKLDHLVSWRTNWDQKPSNLKSLAAELNLGLDSFIFIDDNPIECAEVKSECPEVLTLQLPLDEQKIPGFLKNIWVFDHLKVTEEDKKRTQLYKQNVQRERHRTSSMSLKDFLEGLNLQINISVPDSRQINRVSQLTFRTNQFNFTTKRRSEQEIREFLSDKNNGCLIAEVSDRFGDYGLVGVLFFTRSDGLFSVDTFLLSCRVLGRGVEYKIMSELGKLASAEAIEFIDLKYIPSPKNKPALDFIKRIGSQFSFSAGEELISRLPSDYLADLKHQNFVEQDSASLAETNSENNSKSYSRKERQDSDSSDKYQMIADEYNNAASIYKKVEEHKTGRESRRENILKPETDFEKNMAAIWQKVLNRTEVSLDDNFFETGGSSLKAVQLVASAKKDLNINISIVDIFECPTIKLLAQKFRPKTETINNPVTAETGAERGSRRRNLAVNRKRK
jgi:FkbH-like protein/FkbM family methyltransferase